MGHFFNAQWRRPIVSVAPDLIALLLTKLDLIKIAGLIIIKWDVALANRHGGAGHNAEKKPADLSGAG